MPWVKGLRHTGSSREERGVGVGGVLNLLADNLCHSCSITLLPTALVSLSQGFFLHDPDCKIIMYLKGPWPRF